jgi:hypothetical protein
MVVTGGYPSLMTGTARGGERLVNRVVLVCFALGVCFGLLAVFVWPSGSF